MGKRFAKQLGQFIVTLFGITFLTFCLTYLAPGDPVTMLLETADTIVSQELIDETRAQLGLDKPFLVQYEGKKAFRGFGFVGFSFLIFKDLKLVIIASIFNLVCCHFNI